MAFREWRTVPAPVRGALVKRFGQLLTEHKQDVADLVGVEVGKIRSEVTDGVLVGPLLDGRSFAAMTAALEEAVHAGAWSSPAVSASTPATPTPTTPDRRRPDACTG